jgi:hypothetical protein
MWTEIEQDDSVLRAEQSVVDTLTDFMMSYYKGRLPSVDEIAASLGVDPETVIAALSSEEDEE